MPPPIGAKITVHPIEEDTKQKIDFSIRFIGTQAISQFGRENYKVCVGQGDIAAWMHFDRSIALNIFDSEGNLPLNPNLFRLYIDQSGAPVPARRCQNVIALVNQLLPHSRADMSLAPMTIQIAQQFITIRFSFMTVPEAMAAPDFKSFDRMPLNLLRAEMVADDEPENEYMHYLEMRTPPTQKLADDLLVPTSPVVVIEPKPLPPVPTSTPASTSASKLDIQTDSLIPPPLPAPRSPSISSASHTPRPERKQPVQSQASSATPADLQDGQPGTLTTFARLRSKFSKGSVKSSQSRSFRIAKRHTVHASRESATPNGATAKSSPITISGPTKAQHRATGAPATTPSPLDRQASQEHIYAIVRKGRPSESDADDSGSAQNIYQVPRFRNDSTASPVFDDIEIDKLTTF